MARKSAAVEVEEEDETYDEEDDGLDANYGAEPDDLTDAQIKRLHGHGNIRANICFECRGRLFSQTGSHAEYRYDNGSVSFAAAICLYCKQYRAFVDWGHVIPAAQLDEVITRLMAHNNGVNYAIACWILTVMDKESNTITERRYCVNLNGEIVTRKDTLDLHRTLKSLETDGWHVYTPKIKVKNVQHALHLVGETLEPRGYTRQF